MSAIDFIGGWIKVVNEYDDPKSFDNITDLGTHIDEGRQCHVYQIDTCVYHHVIGQDVETVRRWNSIDNLSDILNGCGFGLDISGGIASLTGVGSIPAGGLFLGGILCHTASEILDALNGYVDKPVGAPFEISKTIKILDTIELHIRE